MAELVQKLDVVGFATGPLLVPLLIVFIADHGLTISGPMQLTTVRKQSGKSHRRGNCRKAKPTKPLIPQYFRTIADDRADVNQNAARSPSTGFPAQQLPASFMI